MSCHGGNHDHGNPGSGHEGHNGRRTGRDAARILMWAAGLGALALLLWVLLARGSGVFRGGGNFLIYGLVLLCPLMHLFMHRGHGHGSRQPNHRGQDGAARGSDSSQYDG